MGGFELQDETAEEMGLNEAKKNLEKNYIVPDKPIVKKPDPVEPLPEAVPEVPKVEGVIKQKQILNVPSEFKSYKNGFDTVIIVKRYPWGHMYTLNDSQLPTKKLWEYSLSGIEIEGMNNKKLTVGDFYYLSFERRRLVNGPQNFNVPVECYNENPDTGHKCRHKNEFTIFDSKERCDIEFDYMDATREEIPQKIKVMDKDLEMYPITVDDAFVLMERNLFSNSLAQFAITIKNMRFDDAFKFLNDEDMDGSEAYKVHEAFHKFDHRVKPIYRKCAKCKLELIIMLDFGGTSLIPFRPVGNSETL